MPHILKHVRMANTGGWEGTEITVIISGNWTTYKVLTVRGEVEEEGSPSLGWQCAVKCASRNDAMAGCVCPFVVAVSHHCVPDAAGGHHAVRSVRHTVFLCGESDT